MLAATYPLLNVFWIMLWLFAFCVWIWVLIAIFRDIFRSPDLGGLAKAIWFLFVLFVPLVGVVVYLVARGHAMHERSVEHAEQHPGFGPYAEAYAQQSAATRTTTDA